MKTTITIEITYPQDDWQDELIEIVRNNLSNMGADVEAMKLRNRKGDVVGTVVREEK